MASSDKTGGAAAEWRMENPDRVFDFLCVDEFLKTIFQARALSTAFEIGLIDALIGKGTLSCESLTGPVPVDRRGMRLLIGMLLENKVIEERDGAIRLTEGFVRALAFRDLLELKSALAHLAAHDFLNYFNDLVSRPEHFPHRARFFRLFAYDRCSSRTPENEKTARQWMKITTTLTKYEAPVCMKYHDFGRYRKILDVGGNSGEFVLQVCRRYAGIRADVFDLPLVCEIGRQHVGSQPEAGRISFIEGDARTDELPGPYDLIVFKSMLHDWPEKEVGCFLDKACRALAPGGTLLIFERAPVETERTGLFYSMIPMLLFFHSFRSPEQYENRLRKLGFQGIQRTAVDLEMPFFLLAATKKID